MAIVISPHAEVTLLQVGWPVYEALLAEHADSSSPRMTYDGNILEIVSPSQPHEIYVRLLDRLVFDVGRIWDIDIVGTGSTTLKMRPRGAELDASFHVGERAARARREAPEDRDVLVPPDIAVEVDIMRERVDKKALLTALGVAEFWRYDGTRLRAFDLRREGGPEIDRSAHLRGLPIAQLDRFLERRRDVSHALLQDEWQQWLRDNPPA
jgi:Uma2 family endonuclease